MVALTDRDKEVLRAWRKVLEISREWEEIRERPGVCRMPDRLRRRHTDAGSRLHGLIYDKSGNFRRDLRRLLADDRPGLDRTLLDRLDHP